ncbi:MFS-type transporter SLC18B1-like isoform X2 [Watersipora subatra]|uniref:MFS-type transporter SLC18B1-like isoform X2 n=1 Tax=Watersipora subatra TaxID=2589382 RepID=UPI00355AD3B8
MDTDTLDNEEETARLLANASKTGSSEDVSLTKVKHHSMLAIILTLILFPFCIDTLLFPFFPNIATEKGLMISEIGVVFASFDFARFVTAPIAGSMFNICQPKKQCAVGAVIAGGACISFGFTILIKNEDLFFVSCLVIRCVAGIGSAMLNVSGTSLLMKASGYESPTIVAFVETANMVGFSIGPAIGAFLFQFVGYGMMFGVLGVCLVIVVPIFCCLVPKIGLFLMFGTWIFIKLSVTSRSTEMTSYYHSAFGSTSSTMGLLFTIWSICSAVGTLCIAKFVNKKKAPYILLVVWAISIPFILLLGPSPPISYLFGGKRFFLLSATVYGIISFIAGFFYILPFSMALQIARLKGYPEDSLHTYGLLTGLMNSGLCLGSTIGPVLSGVISDYAGFPCVQSVIALLATLMIIFHGSHLLYLKSTNQLSALLMENKVDAEIVKTNNEDVVTKRVVEACSERMKSCLNKSIVSTEAQQPPYVDEDNLY